MLSQHVESGDTLVSMGFFVLRTTTRIVQLEPAKIAWRPAAMSNVREVCCLASVVVARMLVSDWLTSCRR